MTTYEDLHWDSLRFVKVYLYRRLATPLNNALGRLAIARHVNDPEEIREQYRRVEQNLEIALNLVKAWAVLIHVKSGGTIRQAQYRQIAPDGLPTWLVDYLNTQTAFRIGHTLPVLAHPETFYEGLLLLHLIGSAAGTLKEMVTGNAPGKDIWLRVIFEPPSAGPYASLGALHQRLKSTAESDSMFYLQVLQDLMRINGAALKLQNNRRSGEQALAAILPAASTFAALVRELDGKAAQNTTDNQITEKSDHKRPPEAVADLVAVENRSETLIVPPPNFHERLAVPVGTESGPEIQTLEARTPGTGPFSQPPEPGVIEIVEPENASDTLIVPPPDYQRRLSLQYQASRPSRYPPPRTESGDEDKTAPAE